MHSLLFKNPSTVPTARGTINDPLIRDTERSQSQKVVSDSFLKSKSIKKNKGGGEIIFD